MSKQETIKAEIRSTEALSQLSTECIVDFLIAQKEFGDLLECFTADCLIRQLGGIDQILEDHPGAVQDHVANTNASREESEREY